MVYGDLRMLESEISVFSAVAMMKCKHSREKLRVLVKKISFSSSNNPYVVHYLKLAWLHNEFILLDLLSMRRLSNHFGSLHV